ncbi:hybrid sensor histidine kinase/response regulator [Sediminispirochaeta bajacaliforniensis]|uniref:hybrid sensor histidine kinase/response regulator n=1 Tax=Sediminispirochaeta bajacaliforniensis TaxID=148 RepID=UPI0003645B4E|nr:ATP-binding protein [Sediminispirochaeta bajacaliforniensis]
MKPLSYGAFALVFFYAYLAYLILRHNPASLLNRLVALLLTDFAFWALYTTFSTAVEDYAFALSLYKVFSPLWHMFPGIALHIALHVHGFDRKIPGPLRYLLLYVPGCITAWGYYRFVFVGLEMNRWYLMGIIDTSSAWFYLYNAYLLLYVGASITLLLLRGYRSGIHRIKIQSRYLGWSMTISLLLGLCSNALLPSLGIEFPFMAIYWNTIWAVGLSVAVTRYGFSRITASLAVSQLLAQVRDFLLILDTEGDIFTASDFLCHRLRLSEAELKGRSVAVVIEDASFFSRVRKRFSAGAGLFQEEIVIRSVPVLMNISPMYSREGELLGYLCVGHDVRHLRKLRETLRKFEGFIQNALDGIVLTDEQGLISHWNRGMELVTGSMHREMVGKPLWEAADRVVAGENDRQPVFEGAIRSVLREGSAPWLGVLHDLTIQRSDGGMRLVQVKPFLVSTNRGYILSFIIRDVTEYQQMQDERVRLIQQLADAQRLKAIGTLAGGLAHNFNNILGGLYGSLSLLRSVVENWPVDRAEVLDRIDDMEILSRRGAEVVRHLLSISGGRRREYQRIDLVPVVEAVLLMCRNSFDKSVTIKKELPDHAEVLGEPSELEQLLLNLAINGLHAMTIMRQERSQWGGKLLIALRKTDQGCLLVVEDQGVGIDDETIKQMFDPFFTTKEEGFGTGFGLSMVQRIVRDLGAKIDVTSTVGVGTRFAILFPQIEEARLLSIDASEGSSSDEPLVSPHACPGKMILLVDDEAPVRITTGKILERAGYRILTAENGKEAIALHQRMGHHIALTILDLTMPGLSGLETMRQLKEIDPEVMILLTSGGYTAILSHPIIAKPYTPEELLSRVADMIRIGTIEEEKR